MTVWNFKNIWVKALGFPHKKHYQFKETGDIIIYKLPFLCIRKPFLQELALSDRINYSFQAGDGKVISENIIEKTLKENVRNPDAYFVFATQTAADLWADRITETSEVHAVATERFIAWDTFKGESIRSQHQDKKAVPSAMRAIFTSQLIAENAAAPFLKSCIAPEYAKTASGFADWISSFLPGLSLWKKYFDLSKSAPDSEDKDLLVIYEKYRAFLEKHSLFDPAWETPPFSADGKHYFIFFPEILSDYAEYKKILEDAKSDITVIHLPEKDGSPSPSVDFFQDARTEVRNIALRLRSLHDDSNISWQNIAVHVPDMESYGAYIDRELELFQIPHVMRSAKALSATGAGNFFSQAKQCVSEGFSFSSVKKLLLNTELPWKDGESIRQLISFGKANNCICSFSYNEKNIDVWNESFRRNRSEKRAEDFYVSLREKLTRLTGAQTFSEIRERYFDFRETFFDMENCPEKSDRIISRCISELSALIDLEQEFPDCRAPDCFSFFTKYLDGKAYLAQTEERGVQILPYKMGACAPFACHIIADASQSALSVVYKELSFLRDDKRKRILNREDANVTEDFLRLYAMNSYSQPVYCTASAKTFTGYAQASSYLIENNRTKESAEELHAGDFYFAEKKWFAGGADSRNCPFPKKISISQKKSEARWEECQDKGNESKKSGGTAVLSKKIQKIHFTESGKIRISETNLKRFYQCPRFWLQKTVSGLEQQNNEAELMDYFAMGNLYHKILELYCTELKKKNLPVHYEAEKNALNDNYRQILLQSIDNAIQIEKNSFLAKELLKTTKTALSAEIEKTVIKFSQIFEGCIVHEMEKECFYEIPGKNYVCTGRIDCLLYDDSAAEFILVDFKTSSVPQPLYYGNPHEPEENEEFELPDFQMPMYLYLLENQNPPVEAENCGFFSVKAGECTPVTGKTLFERVNAVSKKKNPPEPVLQEQFAPTMQKFKECMELYAQKIAGYDFSVTHENQDFNTCNSCDFRAVCRRVFNISRQD